jgi:hypothetical protein
MSNDALDRVNLHPDGYVEVTLVGQEAAADLEILANRSRELVETHGPMNVLIDARHGRIGRDTRSFAILLRLGRVPNLTNLIVLISDDPNNTEGGQQSGLMISLLSNAFGLQPIYTDNEAEARTKAAHQTAK